MNILVCGAGEVGFSIARQLSLENNDVTVVDQSPELVQRVSETLDVKGVVGHASRPDVLERAGVKDANMIGGRVVVLPIISSQDFKPIACANVVLHPMYTEFVSFQKI